MVTMDMNRVSISPGLARIRDSAHECSWLLEPKHYRDDRSHPMASAQQLFPRAAILWGLVCMAAGCAPILIGLGLVPGELTPGTPGWVGVHGGCRDRHLLGRPHHRQRTSDAAGVEATGTLDHGSERN